MKNAFALLMDMLGGAKAATPGNPAAVPPVLPTAAVGRDKWQARYWFTFGFLPALALVLCLMFLGIGSLLQNASFSLPSWGSNAKAQAPAQQPVTAGTVLKTETPVVPSNIHFSDDSSSQNIGYNIQTSKTVGIYPNVVGAKKEEREKFSLPPGTSATRGIPLGKRASWSKSAATIKWKDLDGRWNPDTKETRNSPTTAIEFTAPADKSAEIEFILTDA